MQLSNEKKRKIITIYVVWVFIHIAIFLGSIVSENRSEKEKFWPFFDEDYISMTESYDFSEFFVYTLSPVVIFFVYANFKKED
ncbi:MAG: hypothetical protein RBR97_09945 [Bacteroidales bacterium]|nr:hypothetical protein [Bacteroidales bacterium]